MTKLKAERLGEWIIRKMTTDDEKCIMDIIEVFSEYIVATNPDYLYNKGYLPAFIDDFLMCKKLLKQKRDILRKEIIIKLIGEGVECEKVVVSADNAWIFENEKLTLLSTFSAIDAKSNKMKFCIEYVGENGFTVANEVDIKDKEYKKVMEDDVKFFIERYNEVTNV